MDEEKITMRQGRVLVVDDEPEIVENLKWGLEMRSHTVHTAADGEAALAILEWQPIDLLVTDLNMPGMDGLTLMDRAVTLDGDLQTIVVTGHADMENAIKALNRGAAGYLRKPLIMDELLISLDRCLEKRDIQRQLQQRNNELADKINEVAALNAGLERRVQRAVMESRHKDCLLLHQSRLAAMGEMIGNIAHQWRQPINALNLILANILSAHEHEELTDGLLREKVASGENIIQKMSATIDDFRTFFQPDKRHSHFDVAEVVQDAIDLMEAGLKFNHINLIFKRPTEPIHTDGFANELSQVLLLLITNAKDAIVARNIADGCIDIQIHRHDLDIRITVSDNGGGIDAGILTHIFEPYFTTKSDGQGTGIGLYMAKVIMERHLSGGIRAQNDGGGARFTLFLPLSETK